MNAKVIGISLLLVFLCVFMFFFEREKFYSPNNLENLMKRTALFGVLGIGVSFVIISSGIDLSIGSIVCLSACLLAVFLKVDYQPIGVQEVLMVRAKEQEIILLVRENDFKRGELIRYDQGRRARSELLTISDIETREFETEQGKSIRATVLTVNKPFSRDDTLGRVARAYPVNEIKAPSEGNTVVSISNCHATLRRRDRLNFVHQDGRIETQTVSSSELLDTDLTVSLVKSITGQINSEWAAVPMRRTQRMPILAAISLVMLIGLALGMLHGILITKLGLQPFVVTLCGLLIYRGLSRWLTNDQVVGFLNEYDDSLRPWVTNEVILPDLIFMLIFAGVFAAAVFVLVRFLQARGRNSEADGSSGSQSSYTYLQVICAAAAGIGGVWFALRLLSWFGDRFDQIPAIPYPFFVLVIATIVAAIFLNRTIWGRYLQALGRNNEAARYSGIQTDRVTILAYVICTGLAVLGGMLFALDYNQVPPSSFGNFYELYAIAAAVLGGCSLRGGEGGILGVVIGTAVMQTLNNLIVLLQISDELELAIIGAVILIGVIADVVLNYLVDRRRTKQSRRAA